jgi:hypothetical protein
VLKILKFQQFEKKNILNKLIHIPLHFLKYFSSISCKLRRTFNQRISIKSSRLIPTTFFHCRDAKSFVQQILKCHLTTANCHCNLANTALNHTNVFIMLATSRSCRQTNFLRFGILIIASQHIFTQHFREFDRERKKN